MSTLSRDWLHEQYVVEQRSTYDIAKELDTTAPRVRRALLKHDIKLRTRAEAQAAALKSGRQAHPTQGKKRSEEERAAISRGMARAWAALPPADKKLLGD